MPMVRTICPGLVRGSDRDAMCTIGAVRVDDGGYALFKNKDFARAVPDALTVDDERFIVRGVADFAAATTDGPSRSSTRWSGASMGANRHGLMVADAHVRDRGATHQNYDELAALALSTTTVDEAIDRIRVSVARLPSWWGNLVLVDAHTMVAAEVRDAEVRVARSDRAIVRTNHHFLFDDGFVETGDGRSADRHRATARELPTLATVEAIERLLAGHFTSEPTGICNHLPERTTVASYVLVRGLGGGQARIRHGHPCMAGASVQVSLPG